MTSAVALLKLSRDFHGARTLEAALVCLRAAIRANTRYLQAYVHLLFEDKKTFDIIGWVAPNSELLRRRFSSIDVSQDALLQAAFAATQPFVVPDLRLDPRADQRQVEYFGNRTAIAIPLLDGDDRLGPLVVPTFADQGVMVPTDAELQFLIQAASLLSVVIGRLRSDEARHLLEQEAARSEHLRALGRMAGEVAHDFNNLLLIIRGNLGVAIEELGSHHVVSLLADADRASERATALTRQLLAYSRSQVLERSWVKVDSLVSSARALVERILPSEILLEVSGELEAEYIFGDEKQLERVLMNLILNARDALGGSGRITLRASTRESADEWLAAKTRLPVGRYVTLEVTDSGHGMDEETQSRIFEPFFTTKATSGGSGLGLCVVDSVVKQHGGAVEVESELSRGTSFKIHLPARNGHPAAQSPQVEPQVAPAGGATLLVVDHDESVLRTVERILKRASYRVLTTTDVERALGLVEEHSVDLLLTDVSLHNACGLDLSRRARARAPHLQVLLMGGAGGRDLSSQPSPHLTKPFSGQELLARVNLLLAAARVSAPPQLSG